MLLQPELWTLGPGQSPLESIEWKLKHSPSSLLFPQGDSIQGSVR